MGLVLVVDDVQTDRELVGQVVTKCGHRVAYASDGNEAISRAKELKPDLILMDVVMPNTDGFNACRILKKESMTSQIPIVLVTSKNFASDKFWGMKQGASEYVSKPFTPAALETIIRRYVAG